MSTKDVTDKHVVTAYRDSIKERNRTPQGRWPEEILHARTGEPVKVCVSAMERAYRHGLIEYGVSLRSGWLTDAGLDLLESD